MSVRINVSATPSGGLVTIHGLLDGAMVDIVAEGLADVGRDCGGLVVDLRDAVLTSPRDLARLVRALDREAAGGPVSLVCDRLSGRRLLARCCRDTSVRVLDHLPGAAEPAK